MSFIWYFPQFSSLLSPPCLSHSNSSSFSVSLFFSFLLPPSTVPLSLPACFLARKGNVWKSSLVFWEHFVKNQLTWQRVGEEGERRWGKAMRDNEVTKTAEKQRKEAGSSRWDLGIGEGGWKWRKMRNEVKGEERKEKNRGIERQHRKRGPSGEREEMWVRLEDQLPCYEICRDTRWLITANRKE